MQDPVETGIITSLKDARKVWAHHGKEQKKEGMNKRPRMWVSLS